MTNDTKLVAAIRGDDEANTLKELALELGRSFNQTGDSRARASISKELREISKRLGDLRKEEERKAGLVPDSSGTPLQQLAARRKANGQSVPTGMARAM